MGGWGGVGVGGDHILLGAFFYILQPAFCPLCLDGGVPVLRSGHLKQEQPFVRA